MVVLRKLVSLVMATTFVILSASSCQIAQALDPAPSRSTVHAPVSLQLGETSLEKQVLDLLNADKYEEAQQLLLDATKGHAGKVADAPTIYLQAFLEFNEGDYKAAAGHLERVRELAGSQQGGNISEPWLLKRLGDCYFNMRDFVRAAGTYQAALVEAKQKGASKSLVLKLDELVMSSLTADGKYQSAVPFGQQFLQLASARATSGQLADLGDLVWAYLENLDLLRRMGSEKDSERVQLRNQAAPFMAQLLQKRFAMEQAGLLPSPSNVQQSMLENFAREIQPRTVAEFLWLANDFKVRSLPLIGWFPKTPPAGAILCIHGLGLENRAFRQFGEDMTKRGFSVYALDVRGFGSWLTVPAQEEVQFDYALADIGGVLSFVKQMNPKLPVFLLGESMGGGIALQAAARYGGDLSGVISSVPSPDRYEERRSTMTVAVHFVKGKNNTFDITNMVAKKATSSEEELESWTSDPKAKMAMSAAELMKFDTFMRSTKSACQKITDTPVFIVQGLKDKLVKPQGTMELFDAVATDEKSMMIVGDASHLIFETHNPDPTMLDTVAVWISHRTAPRQKAGH